MPRMTPRTEPRKPESTLPIRPTEAEEQAYIYSSKRACLCTEPGFHHLFPHLYPTIEQRQEFAVNAPRAHERIVRSIKENNHAQKAD